MRASGDAAVAFASAIAPVVTALCGAAGRFRSSPALSRDTGVLTVGGPACTCTIWVPAETANSAFSFGGNGTGGAGAGAIGMLAGGSFFALATTSSARDGSRPAGARAGAGAGTGDGRAATGEGTDGSSLATVTSGAAAGRRRTATVATIATLASTTATAPEVTVAKLEPSVPSP